jgi:hypothetical protein
MTIPLATTLVPAVAICPFTNNPSLLVHLLPDNVTTEDSYRIRQR